MLCFVVINNVVFFWLSGLLFSFLTFYVFGFGLGRTMADILGWFPHGILSVTFVKLPVDWQPAAPLLHPEQNQVAYTDLELSEMQLKLSPNPEGASLPSSKDTHSEHHFPTLSFKPVLGVWESYEQCKYIGCRQVFLVFEKSTGRYLAKSVSNLSLRCLRFERSA